MNVDGAPNLDDDGASVAEDVEATLVYDAYRASVEAGQPAAPEKLFAKHSALADRLKTLIRANGLIAAIAGDVVPNLGGYRIIRELGRGGKGIVYEAEQISRGRRVAIKVLTAAAAIDPQHLKRFLQVEVPAAKLLRHPHIVPIIDVGCEHGVYYYAMQYIGGQDLAQLIKAHAKPDGVDPAMDETAPRPSSTTGTPDLLRIVARWGRQAAEALDYVRRLCHRHCGRLAGESEMDTDIDSCPRHGVLLYLLPRHRKSVSLALWGYRRRLCRRHCGRLAGEGPAALSVTEPYTDAP